MRIKYSSFLNPMLSENRYSQSQILNHTMDWFNRLENKVVHILSPTGTAKAVADIRMAFKAARVESQQGQPGGTLRIAASDIRPQDIMSTFQLQYETNAETTWQIQPEEQRPIPEHLSKSHQIDESQIQLTQCGTHVIRLRASNRRC